MRVKDTEEVALLDAIKRTVMEVDPHARVILFGSHARGNANADSDWDILVLSSVERRVQVEGPILDRLYDLELEWGETIIPLVYTYDEWNDPVRQCSPFVMNVAKDGVAL